MSLSNDSLNIESLTDDNLLILLKEGNDKVFEQIYNRYKGVLYLHAYRMLQDRDEAKDVLHDVFIKLWSNRENINALNLSAYLYTSIRNVILDKFAHSKVKNRYLESVGLFLKDYNPDRPDALAEYKELYNIIESEIQNLPEKMRVVFVMSRKLHMSHREIGQELGISELTVKKQVNNALKILRSKFSDRDTFIFFLFIYSLS